MEAQLKFPEESCTALLFYGYRRAASQQWDGNCLTWIQGLTPKSVANGDCHKTRCDGTYRQWSAMRSVWCKILECFFLVSIWLAAIPLVGMRTVLRGNLFSADGIWSSTAVFTSRITTADSPNLIILECNKKRRDTATLLAGSARNSSPHRCGLWVPLRENLLKI